MEDGGPVALPHGQDWFIDDPASKLPVNGDFQHRNWSISTAAGGAFGEQGDLQKIYSHLDYFLLMFPTQHLGRFCVLTNNQLTMISKPRTTKGEILHFFGILILFTRFDLVVGYLCGAQLLNSSILHVHPLGNRDITKLF